MSFRDGTTPITTTPLPLAPDQKAKVAFFDFTCCEGCQIEQTNHGDATFLGLLDHVEIVEFREAMSEKTTDPIDIAFIEGSYTRKADLSRLQDIRDRSKIIVAYGSCATTGGINALKNHMGDYGQFVYGKESDSDHLDSQVALPVSAAIKVDYEIPGCPIDKDEFVYVVSHLLHGKDPVIPDYPVCVECKMRETVCRYQLGEHCMGLVARAGCGAPCPAAGIPCEACRGFCDVPNEDALVNVLVERGGMTLKRARDATRMFTANNRSDAVRTSH